MSFIQPHNEASRLAALRDYAILDTAAEQCFDDVTQLAAFICGTPIAIMTLVDAYRQWFKSRVGLGVDETPRDQAFCAHTILQSEVFVVEDAALDARFSENPLVTSEPKIRFYAGAPLVNSEGLGLGSLCVIDRHPRKISPAQSEALATLSRVIVAQMELRRVSAQLAKVGAELKAAHGLLPICSYCKGIRNDSGYWQAVEIYIKAHSDVEFSHGMCPECAHKNFPEIFPTIPGSVQSEAVGP